MQKNDNSKAIAAIGYITWIGFAIAYFVRDPSDKFISRHLNQSLIIHGVEVLLGIITRVPAIGSTIAGIGGIVCFVLWVMGIYRALTGSEEPLPLIGDMHFIDK